MVSYIGSILGQAAVDTHKVSQVVPIPGGDNDSDIDENDFFDALEEQTELIETASQ